MPTETVDSGLAESTAAAGVALADAAGFPREAVFAGLAKQAITEKPRPPARSAACHGLEKG